MTTSSFTEPHEPSIFEEGKMYKAKSNGRENMVVLCVLPCEDSDVFEGVVIHQGKSQNPIGRYLNCLTKCSFTDFHGVLVLKS